MLPRPGGRVGLIVGDAMGHGPEAAVAMIQLRTAARTLAGLDTDPGNCSAASTRSPPTPRARPSPPASTPSGTPERHTCTLVGAGHPPPLLLEPDAPPAPATLAAPACPWDSAPGPHEPTVLTIDQPTLLLLYSDGLVECRHHDIDHEISPLARPWTRAAGRTPGASQEALQSLCDGCCTTPSDPAPPTTRRCCSPN